MSAPNKTPGGNWTHYAVPSMRQEFETMMFWAALASGTREFYEVDEETGNRPVWGPMPNAKPLDAQLELAGKKQHRLKVRVETVGKPVGTSCCVKRLLVLHLYLPPGLTIDEVRDAARDAYEGYFSTGGLEVFFTRKIYESVEWQKFGSIPRRPLSSVKLSADIEKSLLNDARAFVKAEAEYTRLGRPYKRVYCLYGPPGTGKTSVVMAIASELKRPVAIFNVDSLRDDTFIDLLSDRPKNAILLFEDVDALFKGRDSGASAGGMTFSTLLNALDGVLHPRGALVFLTTNHLDKLDDALRRPGRVDRLVEVPYADLSQAIEIWRLFFPKHDPPASVLSKACGKTGIAPARLSETLFVNRNDAAAAIAAIAAMSPKSRPKSSPKRMKKLKSSL